MGNIEIRRAASMTALLIGAAACSSSSAPSPAAPDGGPPATSVDAGTDAPVAPEFHADSPNVYVPKVKNLLVGLPPTDAELGQVAADPSALKSLIAGWMALPEYQDKMMRFFQLAFQQTQVAMVDFADQAYPRQLVVNATTAPLLLQNAQESFARTMLSLTAAEHPLAEANTTRQFMMTTAMKELYAFLDVWEVDDDGKVTDRFKQSNPGLTITVGTAQGAIPIEQTLDPTSANYMHWYNPDVATEDATIDGCAADPISYAPSALTLHWLLYGSLENRKGTGGVTCAQLAGSATAAQLTAADFADWQMITVRTPQTGEAVTSFYDLPTLRSSTELVLNVPRVGFFSTPAFFANWQTNISNQMRVTMNQTLIVALGSSVDGTDGTQTPGNPPPGLDSTHASNAACASCHQTLDPLRSIFSANYSWNYHNQLDTTLRSQDGMFSFRGVIQPVTSMADMGAVLSQHPLFASAWAQKLCYYANSAPCADSDPEFQRVVQVFKDSNLSWNTLLAELLSSPLVTHAAETKTSDVNGEVLAVARRDHLCAAFDNRLGFDDVCGRNALTKKAATALIPSIASGLPSDGYGRGSTTPVLPNEPTLFFRAGTENICAGVAAQVIDVPAAKQVAGVKQWSSASPDAAIADFVATVMALAPSDTRSAPAVSVLRSHFDAARQQGATASDALKSTFVAACLAPSSISIGL
jgi:hypothetical protein